MATAKGEGRVHTDDSSQEAHDNEWCDSQDVRMIIAGIRRLARVYTTRIMRRSGNRWESYLGPPETTTSPVFDVFTCIKTE